MSLFERNETGAVFSPCRKYRYRLWRRWSDGPTCMWLMLNPSKATEYFNDPTVERCERRTRKMRFGEIRVCNLFAFRATDPADMKRVEDPVGPDNNRTILDEAKNADMIICAWGNHGGHALQAKIILDMLKGEGIELHYLE